MTIEDLEIFLLIQKIIVLVVQLIEIYWRSKYQMQWHNTYSWGNHKHYNKTRFCLGRWIPRFWEIKFSLHFRIRYLLQGKKNCKVSICKKEKYSNKMVKVNIPEKVCIVCNRPFSYRKKWRNCWDEVKYCSKRCRGNRWKK